MALVFKERVKESTSTAGTGTLTLTPIAQFQAFSGIGNGNQTYYGLQDGDSLDWEVGVGTYTLSGTTLSRDSVLASSNAGNRITISGTSTVFCTYPANRSVVRDLNDRVLAGESGINFLSGNLRIGPYSGLGMSGINNIAEGSGAGAYSSQQRSVLIGNLTGSGSVDGTASVMVGQLAGASSWRPTRTVFVGTETGKNSRNLSSGVIIGNKAGLEASGHQNVYIGYRAGIRASGNNNIGISTTNVNFSVIGANSNKIYVQGTIAGDTSSNKIAIGAVTATHLSPTATLQLVPKATGDVAFRVNPRASGAANAIEASGKCHFRSQYGVVAQPTGSTIVTLDLDQSNFFNITLDSNKTFSVTNSDVGQCFIVNVRQNSGVAAGAGYDVTWWSGIKWADQLVANTPPATSDNGNLVDTFGFTIPSGNKYYGYIIGTGIYDPL